LEKARASRTAVGVAIRRASHQLRDSPLVFRDPVAVPILGETYSKPLSAAVAAFDDPFSRGMRAFLVARSRYAEDNLQRAVSEGVRQYVLLGAGLDTFAYRNHHADLRVFEVDHPATQAWKRELLARSQITIPASLTFVPVDFELQSLAEQLRAQGFDPNAAAYFAWLGVVPYLTLSAFRSTLGYVGERPPGSGVTFDYGQPRQAIPRLERIAHDALAARVGQVGEPLQLFFTPPDIARELSSFRRAEDLGSAEMTARYFAGRSDGLRVRGQSARFASAWR
jgi:methyltransferase (TIGR00027 family)